MDGDHDYKDGGLDALLWAAFKEGAQWELARRRASLPQAIPSSMRWWFACKRAFKAWREELVSE